MNENFFDLSDFGLPLTPIDGRYHAQTKSLVNYLSEAALNRMRIFVEIEWIIALADGLPVSGFDSERVSQVPGLRALTLAEKAQLREIPAKFDKASVQELAEIESETKHDVKAIEYYIKRRLHPENGIDLEWISPAVHIFCTSEDINNLSYSLCLKYAVQNAWLPALREFVEELVKLANAQIDTPMLAKTHGQPATPTTLGKEIAVFVHRLNRQVGHLERQEYLGKINGATGTFGAHFVSVPNENWPKFAEYFVEECLGLTYNPLTTQIESHDAQAELYDTIAHIGRILHNFATDIWTYISNDIFVQIPEDGATGSSTMPHKVNPIKFENAEANFEISDAIFAKLSQTLTTSRMQRDLTDSTTQRNISTAFAHSLLAISNLTSGITMLKVNNARLEQDLDENPAVLGEAVQSVMRAAGIAGVQGMEDPYERLKKFSRGQAITFGQMQKFIDEVSFPEEVKTRLKALTPAKYIGLSAKIAREVLDLEGGANSK